MQSFLAAFVLLIVTARCAQAHTSGDVSATGFDPFGAALLAIVAAAYAVGQWRLARRSRGEHATRAACFWSGWVALAMALGPPLHALTPMSFAAHMTQHEIMMLVAAPLLVVARPLGTLLWGLPEVFSAVVKASAVRRVAGWVSAPVAAWITHTVVLWGWHVPAAFEAGLRSNALHWLQHSSFFLAAVIFWWSVFAGGRSGARRGIAILSVFTTAVHTTVLGALLTFSTTIWYPTYAASASPWGLSPIEDQQLGGLIMWVPGGMVFLAAGMALAALWLKESEIRAGRG
jgi:cytochrome c oxidase assembly factor CtaG